jgi:hypothetical protein
VGDEVLGKLYLEDSTDWILTRESFALKLVRDEGGGVRTRRRRRQNREEIE